MPLGCLASWLVVGMASASARSGGELVRRLQASPAVLAPLTRAGTAPFRGLCVAHGCEATMGEMIFARFLNKGDRREVARLRRHESEGLFGAQIATKQISEGVEACERAHEAGADWVDLNCGCPIYEATRRGLGSSLLRKPKKLARLVEGIVAGSPLPVSVKLRLSGSTHSTGASLSLPTFLSVERSPYVTGEQSPLSERPRDER